MHSHAAKESLGGRRPIALSRWPLFQPTQRPALLLISNHTGHTADEVFI